MQINYRLMELQQQIQKTEQAINEVQNNPQYSPALKQNVITQYTAQLAKLKEELRIVGGPSFGA